ncbi:MFS transporter [Brucella gallinifaecis]|uniref:MFS transporter n=1 Tax=Brucella gallinifaecis TaxID=215590 RepID=A0A502BQ66_9HYPH|nr:MFS transporter [Brucella gallinifaecis]TPF75288.1 MFS transporter [Brucella gallinifaecis]
MNEVCDSAIAAEGVSASSTQAREIPLVVYCLTLGIFALTTSELMISGMMPALQQAFGRSVSDIGNLISVYALGMTVGGPLVTILFLALKIENKRGLLFLLVFYALAQSIAASTSNFHVMLVARVLTGMAAATSFGLMLAITAQLVIPELRGRASSLVFAGLMLCTVLGVPLATLITTSFGWRSSFWAIVVLILFCALVIAIKIEARPNSAGINLSSELNEMRKPRLWAAYATSALVIGASFSVYSYLAPITVQLSGFSEAQLPFLLAVYGAANIAGNYVIGRFADRHTIATIFTGILIMLAAMLLFALFAELKTATILAIVMIGLTGIALNPAFIARVMRIAHPGALVNAMHASVINIGLGVGPWAGGYALSAGYSLYAPLWVGVIMTLLGLLTLAPRVLRKM